MTKIFRIVFVSIILTTISFQFAFPGNFQKGDEDSKPIPYDSVAIKPLKNYIELMSDWLEQNILYLSIAQEEGLQGVVHVSYVIDRDGYNTQVEVINDAHPYLSKEVIRAICASPRCPPGIVPMLVEAKVHFILIPYPYSDSIKYEDNVTNNVNINIKVFGFRPIPKKPVTGIIVEIEPAKPKFWYNIKRKFRKWVK